MLTNSSTPHCCLRYFKYLCVLNNTSSMTASVWSRLSDFWTHYKVTEPYTLTPSSNIRIEEVPITATLLIKQPIHDFVSQYFARHMPLVFFLSNGMTFTAPFRCTCSPTQPTKQTLKKNVALKTTEKHFSRTECFSACTENVMENIFSFCSTVASMPYNHFSCGSVENALGGVATRMIQ